MVLFAKVEAAALNMVVVCCLCPSTAWSLSPNKYAQASVVVGCVRNPVQQLFSAWKDCLHHAIIKIDKSTVVLSLLFRGPMFSAVLQLQWAPRQVIIFPRHSPVSPNYRYNRILGKIIGRSGTTWHFDYTPCATFSSSAVVSLRNFPVASAPA